MDKNQVDDIEHQIDSRTNLPGRDQFYSDAAPKLRSIDSEGSSLFLLVIDIEGLEFVLRTFGPVERNAVVREVGARIRRASKVEHVAYHIDQDRFAQVVDGGVSYRQIVSHVTSLIDEIKKPFEVAQVLYNLDAHAGISNYPDHADSLAELVRTSVFACHQARKTDKEYATFDYKQDKWEQHSFRLLVDLEKALETDTEIGLAYQPLVDLSNGKCKSVEGLCRWIHKELGLIPPDDFLPYVEQTALMMPFTEVTIGIGLKNCRTWLDEYPGTAIAFNLSTNLLQDPSLLECLREQIRFYNMAPDRIHFEVTETGIMKQPLQAATVLQAIRDWGCQIDVDDFGTGHSSLAYVADLPVDVIKIDRHFINLLDRPRGEAIVAATVMLASKLGLKTVAEGIETQAQYDACQALGITYGQGYFIGKPMGLDDLVVWMKHNLNNIDSKRDTTDNIRSIV